MESKNFYNQGGERFETIRRSLLEKDVIQTFKIFARIFFALRYANKTYRNLLTIHSCNVVKLQKNRLYQSRSDIKRF